jgi:isopenicillin N synthase-like dioxygenase
LPTSLTDDEAVFKALMREGNTISNIILGLLERQLQLPSGSFTSCHRLEEPSHSFLRILRYPALKAGHELDTPRFFAHRDIVTLAILVTWVCGFQIPKEDAEMIGPDEETEDSWRWVEPLPGYALINLGDAMPIFTNDKLKSGKHRVVTAYGDQSLIDRYSVLVSARPSHATSMKAFKSPMIPEDTPEEAEAEVVSAKTWGDGCVKRFIKEKVKVKAKD